jgi:hypothetical protein
MARPKSGFACRISGFDVSNVSLSEALHEQDWLVLLAVQLMAHFR